MTFKHFLLASCALVISATAATAQIPSYVPTDGLVGWWPFNGNANDESGNGNNGVVNGATLTEDRNGAPNAAYSFDGVNDFIVTNEINFGSNGDYSISVWAKINVAYSSGAPQHYLVANATTMNGAYLNTDANQNQFGCNSIFTSNTLGEWHHFLGVKQNEIFSLIIDNINVGSTQGCMSNLVDGNPIYFGNSSVNTEFTNGFIDDIAIYNRALTEQEIQNLYTGSTETVDTGNGAAPLPQGISYQAAARDVQGQVIADAPVNVRFTLHEGAADGAASYAETHALTTNGVGLFNTVFGNGTPEQSAFDSINWAATTKFLQVEIDLGEGYVDMGTTQLLSVPYALRSDEAARVKNAGLPVFNDNAAALAGGLVAGEMYRTSAGVLMIAY
jgi:hypothetical protein